MDCGRQGLATLGEAGLDPFEAGVLDVVRHYCRCYAHPESMGWETALDIAAERFGRSGGEIAHAAMCMLRELRTARRSTFKFSNPCCPCCCQRITPHEVKLMRLVRHSYGGDAAAARAEAMILCEGQAEAGLVEAVGQLNACASRSGQVQA